MPNLDVSAMQQVMATRPTVTTPSGSERSSRLTSPVSRIVQPSYFFGSLEISRIVLFHSSTLPLFLNGRLHGSRFRRLCLDGRRRKEGRRSKEKDERQRCKERVVISFIRPSSRFPDSQKKPDSKGEKRGKKRISYVRHHIILIPFAAKSARSAIRRKEMKTPAIPLLLENSPIIPLLSGIRRASSRQMS